jgi:clan AA aspartic protease
MITGVVRSQVAWVPLTIRGLRGRARDIEAAIDTGFNGTLMLPAELIQSLHLRWQTNIRGTLADGSHCFFAVYEAIVLWDRGERSVPVVESDADALLGMDLLSGCEVKFQVHEGGKVAIRRLKS